MSSEFIKSQLPAFVVEEYPQFVLFLEKYYDYFSTQQLKIEESKDAASTELLDELVNELAKNLPSVNRLSVPQKRLIVQKISDLYKSKGSTTSIKSLVNILYGVDSEIFLPSELIFKTSAAKWNRDFSIRFRLVSGVLNSFENVQAILKSQSRTIDIDISKIVKLDGTSDIFECYIAGNYTLNISEPTTITTDSFTGELVRSFSQRHKKIIFQGVGYSPGDIFDIDDFGTRIKVTKTTPTSGLKAFEIIQYGNGYINGATINIPSNSILAQLLGPNLTVRQLNALNQLYNINRTTSNDKVNEIIEKILVVKFDYVNSLDYFEDNTYVGEVLRSVDELTNIEDVQNNINARVVFDLGYVFEYPGYYSTNVGFPSDASYLQDGEYYQQFSYVIKSTEQYERYSDAVTNLVHPAGLRLFGEYFIERELNILVDVVNRLSLLDFNVQDIVEISDFLIKIISRNLEDVIIASEIVEKTLDKVLFDTYNVSDNLFKTLSKTVDDESLTFDLVNKTLSKPVDDAQSVTDVALKTTSKDILEELNAINPGCLIANGYYLTSETVTNNGTYWDCGYAIGETILE